MVTSRPDRDPTQRAASGTEELIAIVDLLSRVAPTRMPVLLLSSRTPVTELLARLIHHASGRAAAPFAVARCGLFPRPILERQLLGAATHLHPHHEGLLHSTSSGTLFIDQIQNTSPLIQDALETLLQQSSHTPAPSVPTLRIIASAGVNLEPRVRSGLFRPGLFYRLGVAPIAIPRALRSRAALARALESWRRTTPAPATSATAQTIHHALLASPIVITESLVEDTLARCIVALQATAPSPAAG